ncbi:MAG: HAMP domain-containing sensor histidine kinase [bacterium]
MKLRINLSIKIFIIFSITCLLILSLAGFGIYRVLYGELERQVGNNLMSLSRIISLQIKGEWIDYLIQSQVDSRYYSLQKSKLEGIKNSAALQGVDVIDINNRVIISTDQRIQKGGEYYPLTLENDILSQLKQGKTVESMVYEGYDNKLYKTGYTPVADQKGDIAAIVACRASADFLIILNKIKTVFIKLNLIGLAIILIVGLVMTRSITTPILKISKAASDIGNGKLETRVKINSSDELGNLAQNFNNMAVSLQKGQNLLKERVNALSVLAGGIAHEVRNPLNGMNLNLDLIKRNLDNPQKIKELIQRLRGDIKKLSFIVTRLLDYTRPLEPAYVDINLKNMLDVLCCKLKKENINKNIKFEVIETGKPVKISADNVRMEQVFYNLLVNAVQAINSIKGMVQININETESSAVLQFMDTGCGIKEEDKERIFDPFFTTRAEGTGLGMAIVKKIVESHSGVIFVGDLEPESNFKTNICIHLPKRL